MVKVPMGCSASLTLIDHMAPATKCLRSWEMYEYIHPSTLPGSHRLDWWLEGAGFLVTPDAQVCIISKLLGDITWFTPSLRSSFKENEKCCTYLRDLLKDTLHRERERKKKEKIPAQAKNWTPRPPDYKACLYHCAVAAEWFSKAYK